MKKIIILLIATLSIFLISACASPVTITGCMDPEALNYNPEATESDRSCQYAQEIILGCTDSNALNYDPEATEDDGSCKYLTDQACNPEFGVLIPEIPGVCWQKQVSGLQRNHENSIEYCNELQLGNLKWDVPTREELVKLRNYLCENKTTGELCPMPCDPYGNEQCGGNTQANLQERIKETEFKGFTGVTTEYYWTSTYSNPPTNDRPWRVGFDTGIVTNIDVARNARVICVSR